MYSNLSKDNFKEQASFDQSVGIVLAVTLLLRNLPYRGVYVQNNSLQQSLVRGSVVLTVVAVIMCATYVVYVSKLAIEYNTFFSFFPTRQFYGSLFLRGDIPTPRLHTIFCCTCTSGNSSCRHFLHRTKGCKMRMSYLIDV